MTEQATIETKRRDPGLASFSALVASWSRKGDIASRRLASDADGTSQRSRLPMWMAIASAKSGGSDEQWNQAMELLAQAALDHRRPIMVASVALSSIFGQGHDVPFESLRRLVEPVMGEKWLGTPGYDWEHSFPLERSRDAWGHALKAMELAEPSLQAPPPAHFRRRI